jgi:hypothetical protein
MKKNTFIITILTFLVTLDALAANKKLVDLGLSVKWASCNVGANNPWEDGEYYGWGDTPLGTKTGDAPTGEISGTKYDIAHVKWQGAWRMPTSAEILELYNKCHFSIVNLHNKKVLKVTGPNGNFIYLPAAGGGNAFDFRGSGNYMSSYATNKGNGGNSYSFFACLHFDVNSGSVSLVIRSTGLITSCSVRPVVGPKHLSTQAFSQLLSSDSSSSSNSSRESNNESYLTVNGKRDVTSSYSYSGGTYSYTVNTNASDYEVNALPSWCSASKSGNTFTITCQRNSDNSSRADWFRVKAGSLEVKVHVSQGGDPNAIAGEIENVWIDFDAVQQNFFLYTKGMNIHIKFKTNNLYNTNCAACAFFYYQNGTPLDDCDFQYRTSDGHVYAETSFKPGYTNCTYNDLVIFMPYPQLHMAIGTYNLKFDLELQEKSSGSWKTFARKNDNNFLFYNTGF